MPELPEVETVKNALKKLIINKTISDVEVRCEKLIKNVSVEEFTSTLTNQTFRDVRRYGKYLLIDLDKNTLVSHLRMEGKYNYYDEIITPTKHDHVIFYFTDNTMLCYNDTRQFGTMELVALHDENSLKGIDKLGLEPFDKKLTKEYLYQKASKKSITIKQFLLDQSIITGLGNIYVDEVLFRVKLHPKTKVNTISIDKFDEIIKASKEILKKAIKAGGTTVHSFLVTGNISGKFQNQLYVYGREGEECLECGTTIKKFKLSGRGTHYCPHCQGEL